MRARVCARGHVIAEVGTYGPLGGQCRACVRDNSRARWLRLKDEITAKRRTPEFRARERQKQPTRYGLAVWEYDALVQKQGGVCAICARPETALSTTGGLRPLAVDHDHDTGAIRGLLCNACNAALGGFQDDLATVEAALWYLRFALRDELVDAA